MIHSSQQTPLDEIVKIKSKAPLTPGRSAGGWRSSGGGADGGGLVPGQEVGCVVHLTQRTPPAVVEGVLVWRQPVLVLDVWVPVRCQHLDRNVHTVWKDLTLWMRHIRTLETQPS